MWTYRRPPTPDELYHWGVSAGGKVEGSKYYQRIETGTNKKTGNPVYRYFYSAAEWLAYNNKKQAKSVNGMFLTKKESLERKAEKEAKKANKTERKATELEKKAARLEREANKLDKKAEKSYDYESQRREHSKMWTEDSRYNKYEGNKKLQDAELKVADKLHDKGKRQQKKAKDARWEAEQLRIKAEEYYKESKQHANNSTFYEEQASKIIESGKGFLNRSLTGNSNPVASTKKAMGNKNISGTSMKEVNNVLSNIEDSVKKAIDSMADSLKEVAVKMEDIVKGNDEKLTSATNTGDQNVHEKTNVDPNSDPYDNTYTHEQLVDNLKKTGWYDSLVQNGWIGENDTEEDTRKRLVDNGYMEETETLSQWFERQGLIDETSKGMHPETFDDLKKQDTDVDEYTDMAYVNHSNLDASSVGYGEEAEYGYSNNCAYCTLAYDMRQRGYDVEASAASLSTSNTLDVIASWYEGGKFTDCTNGTWEDASKLMSEESTNGNARGQFCVMWTTGGGHSMSYEVKNGEVYIKDAQINKEYKYDDWVKENAAYVSELYYMRTDDKELTENALVGVKNRNTNDDKKVNSTKRRAKPDHDKNSKKPSSKERNGQEVEKDRRQNRRYN